uniref:ABC transporter C n=1 Tax=Lissorhoptrus oryzophilus TaxID=308863 RepID=A0A2R4FXB0_9CUCU|nr:ABC transporter C [Lissorhoptrus oryzophilus]
MQSADCFRRERHFSENSNVLSRLLFFYTLKLFRRGRDKPIEEHDLYEVPSKFKSHQLGDKLEKLFREDTGTCRKPSIYRLLWKAYGIQYAFIGLMQLFARSISVVSIPLLIGKLVSYFVPEQTHVTKQDAITYAILIIALNIFNCLYLHNYQLLLTGLGIKIRTAFCSLIYRQVLKLPQEELSGFTAGKITTFIQKDVRTIQEFVKFGNDIWIGLVQACLVCYLIYIKMGVGAFSGLGTFVLVLPLQIFVAKWAGKFRTQIGENCDKRIQITKETLSAIKLIKTYTWECVFQNKIQDSRKKELRAIMRLFIIKTTVTLISSLTSRVAFYFLLMTHVWMGNYILAEDVFFVLCAFQKLRQAFNVIIPKGIPLCAELHASVKRIENLLVMKERESINKQTNCLKPSIKLNNIVLNGKQLTKEKIDIFKPGLTILLGVNASGKTALINTILGNILPTTGEVSVQGTLSYASQEPWVFPSSIRQNILFGEKYDEIRYQTVLRVCALLEDLTQFPKKDQTIIGDTGFNISKGQQARISLARAVYRRSNIYLLDDCLMSLDPSVQEYVFSHCIKEFLKENICIFATHNNYFVNRADYVIELGDSKILATNNNLVLENKTNKIYNTYSYINNNKLVETEEIEKALQIDEGEALLKIKDTKPKANIYTEKNNLGKVDARCYKQYISFGGSIIFTMVIIFFAITQFSKSFSEKFISIWVNIDQNYSRPKNTSQSTLNNFIQEHWQMSTYFSGLILIISVSSIFTALIFFSFTKRCSKNIHMQMISNILGAKMDFFEKNLFGNIINRFSKDLTIIDEEFPFVMYEFIEFLMTICGVITLIALSNALFLIPEFVLLIFLYIIRYFYLPVGRNLQRLDSSTKSSIIGHVNASIDGLVIIRVFNAERTLSKEFDKYQDLNTSASYTSECCTRAFGFALDIICCCFIAIIIIHFLFHDTGTTVGDVGLSITQAMMLSSLLQYGIRMLADLENKMTSVERALEYTTIPRENNAGTELEKWPKHGELRYENVNLQSSSGQTILNDISFTIKPSQKIGVVGRTGAGKSSVISALFRLYDFNGNIFIDDVNTKSISIKSLRRSIGMIPQDPILFSGTIRSNIDPLGQYSDETIWNALEKLQISPSLESLDEKETEQNIRFSCAQKQLICLSRVLVGQHKILILDEATSTVDNESDAIILQNVFDNFRDATVLIIAHKLERVMDLDKVMVVDKGRIVEFDNPKKLLEDSHTAFFKMFYKL